MKGQRKSQDRISALPQDTIEKILTLMPLSDAVKTSILSKKWRYSWASIPNLVFDTDLLDDFGDEELNKYKLVNAIFHVLLLRRAPILEFTLIADTDIDSEVDILSEIDQIILHLSISNNIKKVMFEFLGGRSYELPPSFFSLHGLEHIDLTSCSIGLPSTYKGFSMLKSLRFSEVEITNKMLFKFLTNCPLLEEFTWIRGDELDMELTVYEFVRLFRCLPSVQVLKISKLYMSCIKGYNDQNIGRCFK